MKKVYTVSIALIVLILMAASASAQSGSNVEKTFDKGMYADAYWYGSNGDTSLYVSETQDGNTQISIYGSGLDPATGYYYYYNGFTTITDNVFKNADVSSASLSEISIPIQKDVYYPDLGYYIEELTTLTVKADWTGTGDVSKGNFNYNYGSFSVKGNGKSRSATATGSIDGYDLGTSAGAYLNMYKTITITKNS